MKGLSVSIVFIAIAVVLSVYLGYSMGTSGFSVSIPTFKATEKLTVPTITTTTTPATTTTTPTTTTTKQTTTTTTTTVQAAKLECTTSADCNDGKSCTIDDCVNNKCTHTLIGADCPVATASIATTTTTTAAQTTQTTTTPVTTTTTTTQAPSITPANYIVITEFATKYDTTLSDEFVELYNPTSTEVDIGGWKIQYKSASGTGSWTAYANFVVTKIPPHKFYLAALSSVYSGTTTADYTSVSSNGLSDTGGHIRLIDNNLNEVDKVGWGTAANPEGSAAPAQDSPQGSIERKIYWQDTDNNANDFTTREIRDPQNSKSAELVPS